MRLPSAIHACYKCGYTYMLFDDGSRLDVRVAWFNKVYEHIDFCGKAILVDKTSFRGTL